MSTTTVTEPDMLFDLLKQNKNIPGIFIYLYIYFSYVCPDPPDLLPIFFFSLSLSYLLTNLLLSISFESINVLLPPFVGGKLVLGCDGVHNILYWTARAALV